MVSIPRVILATFGALSLAATALAREDRTSDDRDRLFVIQRSLNANVVVYDAVRGPDGRLDAHNPVSAYWLMNAEHGQREGLNLIEKAQAYGFDVDHDGGQVVIRVKALKDRPILLRLSRTHAEALVRIAGRQAVLRRVYVKTKPGDPLGVDYIELFGVDPRTHAGVHERLAHAG